VTTVHAFENDLLWARSRAGQELFHSNTIAWPLAHVPITWVQVGYGDLAGALDQIDADSLGRASGQFMEP
jgi:hypothetical protein